MVIQAALSNSQIRDHAARILQGEDFKAYQDEQASWNWLKWLMDVWHWLFPDKQEAHHPHNFDFGQWQGPDPIVLKVLVIGSIVVVLGIITFYLIQRFGKRHDPIAAPGITAEQRQNAHEMYLQWATDALQKQAYGEAMHYLFLATVTMVIQDSYFHGAEYLTNREMAQVCDFSGLNNATAVAQSFNRLVYMDEPFWFGSQIATKADYEQFLQSYEQFHGRGTRDVA